jgi:hypothetical protein
MYLQLAEGPTYLAARRKYTHVREYSRAANTVSAHRRALNENGRKTPDNPYIFLPQHITGAPRDMYVREDYFDDLTDAEWKDMAWRLAPFQKSLHQGLSEGEFLSSRADRRKKRQERKEQKQQLKVEKKQAKNAIKAAKAEAIKSGKRSETVSNIMGAIGGVANKALDIFGGGASLPGGRPGEVLPPDDDETRPRRAWYRNPWVIGGGLAALTTLVVVASKRRKRKRRSA